MSSQQAKPAQEERAWMFCASAAFPQSLILLGSVRAFEENAVSSLVGLTFHFVHQLFEELYKEGFLKI